MNETLQIINLILGIIIICVATGGILAKLGSGSSSSFQGTFGALSIAKPPSRVWVLDWRRIAAMLLGATIDFALQYITVRLNSAQVSPSWVFSLPIAIVLFFGVVFGPWVGLFTGVVGDILGFKVLYSFISLPLAFVVGDAILGFIAGLSLFYTRGKFDTVRAIIGVEIIGGIGIIISDFYNSITSQQPFQTLILQDLATGLILFTVILILYDKNVSYES